MVEYNVYIILCITVLFIYTNLCGKFLNKFPKQLFKLEMFVAVYGNYAKRGIPIVRSTVPLVVYFVIKVCILNVLCELNPSLVEIFIA